MVRVVDGVIQVDGVVALISGQVVVTSVSGNMVAVSGTVAVTSGTGVRVSGESVFVYVSGGSLSANVSGNVIWGAGTSGQVWVQTASGSVVMVSGTVSIASGTGVRISGEVVFAYITGASTSVSETISSSLVQVSSSLQSIIWVSGAVSVPTNLSYTLIHLSSNMTISSEFAVYHNASIGGGGYSTKIYSTNMREKTDVVFVPDGHYTLFSGDGISMGFTNSGSLTVAMRMVMSTKPE